MRKDSFDDFMELNYGTRLENDVNLEEYESLKRWEPEPPPLKARLWPYLLLNEADPPFFFSVPSGI